MRKLPLSRKPSKCGKLETSAADWADRVVCISEPEADVIRTLSSTPVEVVGPVLEDPRATPAGFEARADAGFVAGWAAGPGSPNSDALLWFAKEVLPKVKASLPTFRLLVTGANPPADVAWLEGRGVEFVGAVPDLFAFYNGIRLAISPNRFGAGVKLKTVEAIQYGVPAVCTPEGAAGLPDPLASAVWISADPSQFAQALIDLTSVKRTWERFRQVCLAYSDNSSISEDGVARWPSIVRLTADRELTVRTGE